MRPRGHEQFEDDVGAYLLGALPELEAQAFERHVMGCPVCRDELERLRAAADALPRSVPALAAPPALKDGLMRAIDAENAGSGQEAAGRERKRRSRGGLRVRAERAVRRPATAWVSAAFVLAVGVVAGAAVVSTLDDDGGRSRTVTAKVDRSRLPDGSARLLIPNENGEGAVLRVHGLPQTTGREIYQVWLRRGDEVEPESLFGVGSDGSGAAAISDDLRDVDEVMITRERKGGALAPTEPPVVSVAI